MAITGLKTWANADALNTTNLNNDKTILEAKFNSAITTADLSAAAGITNGQLANSLYEVVLTQQIGCTTGVLGGLLTALNGFITLGTVPYDTAIETFTIRSITLAITTPADGTVSPVYTLQRGYYNNTTGAWTDSSDIKAAITTGSLKSSSVTVAPTITTFATDATNPYIFRLLVTTAGTGYVTGDSATISIKLTKALRA
jgi:hypothetical protein